MWKCGITKPTIYYLRDQKYIKHVIRRQTEITKFYFGNVSTSNNGDGNRTNVIPFTIYKIELSILDNLKSFKIEDAQASRERSGLCSLAFCEVYP